MNILVAKVFILCIWVVTGVLCGVFQYKYNKIPKGVFWILYANTIFMAIFDVFGIE